MKLGRIAEATIDYVPEPFRSGEPDDPICVIRALTGLELEEIEEAEQRATASKSVYGSIAALRIATIKAGVASVRGFEGADGRPITKTEDFLSAVNTLDGKTRDAILSDLYTAVRDHAKLKEGERKN